MANNKATVVLSSERYSKHIENLRTVFGEHDMPNIENLATLTINYSINLAQDINFLGKLRAISEMAEDDGVEFSMDVTNDDISDFAEGLQVLKDLKAISEERKRKELWNEKLKV